MDCICILAGSLVETIKSERYTKSHSYRRVSCRLDLSEKIDAPAKPCSKRLVWARRCQRTVAPGRVRKDIQTERYRPVFLRAGVHAPELVGKSSAAPRPGWLVAQWVDIAVMSGKRSLRGWSMPVVGGWSGSGRGRRRQARGPGWGGRRRRPGSPLPAVRGWLTHSGW